MARFKIGDLIEQTRYDEVIRMGKVVKGPFKVDGVDHYQVEWSWHNAHYFGKDWKKYWYSEIDLIADLSSEKYNYRKSNGMSVQQIKDIIIE